MSPKRHIVRKSSSAKTSTRTKRSQSQILLAKVKTIMAKDHESVSQKLESLTSIIKKELKAHACTIYTVTSQDNIKLTATAGLNQDMLGKTCLPKHKGFIGYVIDQKKSLNISSLAKHPRFILKVETGEHQFLGGCSCVPLMWNNDVIGALSIQSKQHKRFSREITETLETLALIIANLIHVDKLESKDLSTGELPTSRTLNGITIHHGLAEGHVILHKTTHASPNQTSNYPAFEENRFNQALLKLSTELDHIIQKDHFVSKAKTPSQETKKDTKSVRDILGSFQIFLNDKSWLKKIRGEIHNGLKAESAIQKTLDNLKERISASQDPYVKDRFWDIQDLSSRLIAMLRGHHDHHNDMPQGGIIVVAESLGPADLLYYQQFDLKGILLGSGMQTAHVAVLARSFDIPVIGRIPDVMTIIRPNQYVLMDGRAGTAVVQPSGFDRQAFTERKQKLNRIQDLAKQFESHKAITSDGVHISLNLNAGLITDLEHIKHLNIDGIGLYRTEIPFMMQDDYPDVHFQTCIYKEIISRIAPKPVYIRTLDIGGDKLLPYFNHAPEDNPMMGWRSIRICLDRPLLLRQQVRAILRASAGEPVHIMFPMISEISEFLKAKQIVEKECQREESHGRLTPLEIKYGAMLEVPSLLWRLEQLLPHIDFLSVGTNDLFQFTYAIDRSNPYINHYCDYLSPSFLSILAYVQKKATEYNVPLSVCGEMASRPLDCLGLLSIGIRRFSLGRSAIGSITRMIRSVDSQNAQAFMAPLLTSTQKSIRNHLNSYALDNQIQI